MGKKWKRILMQRRRNGRVDMPTARPEPVASNSEMIERMKEAEVPVTEVAEEIPVVEAETALSEETVAETPAPAPKRRRRTTRRKKTVSED